MVLSWLRESEFFDTDARVVVATDHTATTNDKLQSFIATYPLASQIRVRTKTNSSDNRLTTLKKLCEVEDKTNDDEKKADK